MITPHRYTPEQIEFMKVNIVGRSRKELHHMFNQHFKLDLSLSQVVSAMKARGFSSGIDTKFKIGIVPHNKGQKGVGGWEPTQFKKGNRPYNYMPVGSERVNGDNYVDVKIKDPRTWKAKHLVVWEEANGPVPKGHAVIFGDGNRRNFDLNNLILVTRQQLAILNNRGLIQSDADLTRTGIIIADLHQKIGEQKKKEKEKQKQSNQNV